MPKGSETRSGVDRDEDGFFDLDEVEMRPQKKTYDVPDGEGGATWRWTRDPAPVRLTLANGVPTFEDGKCTPARPGEMLAPSAEA